MIQMMLNLGLIQFGKIERCLTLLGAKLTSCRSIAEIRLALRTHQKRLQLGDKLQSIILLAERAGVHRDTIYSLLAGNRISEISQIRLSRLIDMLALDPSPPSRLMHISLTGMVPKLGFGLGDKLFLSKFGCTRQSFYDRPFTDASEPPP